MYLYNLTVRVQFRAPGLDVAHQHQLEVLDAVKAVLADRLEAWDYGGTWGVQSDPSNLNGREALRVPVGKGRRR